MLVSYLRVKFLRASAMLEGRGEGGSVSSRQASLPSPVLSAVLVELLTSGLQEPQSSEVAEQQVTNK